MVKLMMQDLIDKMQPEYIIDNGKQKQWYMNDEQLLKGEHINIYDSEGILKFVVNGNCITEY